MSYKLSAISYRLALSLTLSLIFPLALMAQQQDVKIEFMTPSIVHVVKGTPTKTLVVIAQPEEVAVTRKDNTWSSSELTVRQDPKTGALTFLTAKGKVL